LGPKRTNLQPQVQRSSSRVIPNRRSVECAERLGLALDLKRASGLNVDPLRGQRRPLGTDQLPGLLTLLRLGFPASANHVLGLPLGKHLLLLQGRDGGACLRFLGFGLNRCGTKARESLCER
jgi:hypothetical protein